MVSVLLQKSGQQSLQGAFIYIIGNAHFQNKTTRPTVLFFSSPMQEKKASHKVTTF